MRMLRGLTLSILLLGMTALHAQLSVADGLPVPWPFPWAKECPIKWESLQGRYALSDSADADQVILKITVVMKKGLRLVRVTRYTSRGSMLYDGSTYVTDDQKIIRLYLSPTRVKGPSVWAVIKMHYQSDFYSCTASELVPILTVQDLDPASTDQLEYKMVRVTDRK